MIVDVQLAGMAGWKCWLFRLQGGGDWEIRGDRMTLDRFVAGVQTRIVRMRRILAGHSDGVV
jgi:hypothetical protein